MMRAVGQSGTPARSWSLPTLPPLAAAGVGVALAARGTNASAEVADVVLTADRVDGLADAGLIARRSNRIARRAAVGMTLSWAAMIPAATGLLSPTAVARG
jgi:cation transport ATPase